MIAENRDIRAFAGFFIVYAVLFALSQFGKGLGMLDWLQPKGFDLYRLDYALWLMPIAGFFLVYFALPWAKAEAGFGKYFNYTFPALYFFVSYMAFYAAIFYYQMNNAFFGGVGFSKFIETVNPQINYLGMFLNSSFIYFALAGIGAWIVRFLIELGDEEKAAEA